MSNKANPRQIALNGHTASRIRQAMAAHNLGLEGVANLVGCTGAAVSWWRASLSCPSEKFRQKVSTALGIPMADLAPRSLTEAPLQTEPPSKALTVIPKPKPKPKKNGHHLPVPTPIAVDVQQRQVMAFIANTDGTARITLDVILPMAQAMPIINSLLMHGISQQPIKK